MNTESEKTETPMTCEELERAAIAAYHKREAEDKVRVAEWKLKSQEQAFEVLKPKFPLLEKNPDVNDSDFIMCGRKWNVVTTGFYSWDSGETTYSYSLYPNFRYSRWTGWVSDMADLGRFLLAQKDFEQEQEKPFRKRFF